VNINRFAWDRQRRCHRRGLSVHEADHLWPQIVLDWRFVGAADGLP